jgi:hypothetical protein
MGFYFFLLTDVLDDDVLVRIPEDREDGTLDLDLMLVVLPFLTVVPLILVTEEGL